MTRPFPLHRLAALALASIWALVSIGAISSPAPLAAQGSAYYIATLTAPAAEDRLVARGVAWTCRDTTCVANKSTSRPMRVCRGLAREFGQVESFIADGEALTEDRLARCNGD